MTTPNPLPAITRADGIATRDLSIRSADHQARTVTGIGVPYDVETEVWGIVESFAPGSIPHDAGALCYYRHREPIGRVTASRDTPEGAEITVQVSDTQLGREAMTLVEDGVITSFSIGFLPDQYTVTERDDRTHIRHLSVEVREFSLVPDPAYSDARISAFRHRGETPMAQNPDTLTRSDLDGVETRMTDLERSISKLKTGPTDTRPGAEIAARAAAYPTMGHFLKAISAGDEEARDLHRAYTGATTADTVMEDTFIGDFTRLVTDRRRYIPLFSRDTLPATGMSVDYAQLKSDETQVAIQAKEGDDLVKGRIDIGKANAPVNTYGGWTEMTRQLIERATIPTLNNTLTALALRYAAVTDQAVKTAVLAAIKAGTGKTAGADYLALAAANTATAWTDAIVDAAEVFEDRTFALTGLLVDKATFKTLAALKDGDNRLMNVYGSGVNQVGEMRLPSASGNLAGVTVTMLAHAPENTVAFYDPIAFETLESPNAPAQLQDENIINLTKQFSVYGYMAILNAFPGALLPVKVGA